MTALLSAAIAFLLFSANASDTFDIKAIRDPFKSPAFVERPIDQRTELEKHAVTEFKMIGVLTGPHHTRALLQVNGKSYIVSDGVRIGLRNGYIRKILEDRVIVNEMVQDLLGETEVVTTEIKQVEIHKGGAQSRVSIARKTETESGKPEGSGGAPPLGGQPAPPTAAELDSLRQLLGITGNAGSGANGANPGTAPVIDVTAGDAAQQASQAPAPQPAAPANTPPIVVPSYVAPGQVGIAPPPVGLPVQPVGTK